MMESVYHAVPLVTLPVFCDQVANSYKAASDGYALTLELSSVSADSLLAAVDKVITDNRFETILLSFDINQCGPQNFMFTVYLKSIRPIHI